MRTKQGVSRRSWRSSADRRPWRPRSTTDAARGRSPFEFAMSKVGSLGLLERPRIVMSREQLFDLTVGRTPAAFDRTIDNQISRLRRKIEHNPGRPKIITTVRNGGYCLATDVEVER